MTNKRYGFYSIALLSTIRFQNIVLDTGSQVVHSEKYSNEDYVVRSRIGGLENRCYGVLILYRFIDLLMRLL